MPEEKGFLLEEEKEIIAAKGNEHR